MDSHVQASDSYFEDFKTEKDMKIALPTRGSMVDDHFGHCEQFAIYTIEDKRIVSVETLPAPEGCGCKSGVATILAERGVSLMLAGNMREVAKNVLEYNGIRVIRGCSGEAEAVVEAYLQDRLADSGVACAAHHSCSHEQ